MQQLQCQCKCLSFVLTAVLAALGGTIADDSATFQLLQTTSLYCATQAEQAAANSVAECALRCTLTDAWRSFSFISGVCVLSTGVGLMWVKYQMADSSTNFGYEQLIGDRRFWVFQQRKTGGVSFAKNWTDYERGFGNKTEFWSGLQSLNLLTARGNVTLRIEMTVLNGTQYVAEWSDFTVCDASTNYTMQYKSFITASSNVSADALAMQRGMQFSTFDRDNDRYAAACSVQYGGSGGFWFNNCGAMSPNAMYSTTEMGSARYMSCYYIPGGSYTTLHEMRMMLQLN